MNIQSIGNQNNNKTSFGTFGQSKEVRRALNCVRKSKNLELVAYAANFRSAMKNLSKTQKWDKDNKFQLSLYGVLPNGDLALSFSHKIRKKGGLFSTWKTNCLFDTISAQKDKLEETIQNYITKNRKSYLVEYKAD